MKLVRETILYIDWLLFLLYEESGIVKTKKPILLQSLNLEVLVGQDSDSIPISYKLVKIRVTKSNGIGI